jgi:hypothetical protein
MPCSKSELKSARLWRERNPDKVKAATRKWKTANPDAIALINARSYANHREKRIAYQRQWYLANKESIDQTVSKRRKTNPEWFLFYSAKARAKRSGIPFSITVSDIVVPSVCPVFGTPLTCGVKSVHDSSASLDRIIPELGYVKGNIAVISHRANRIKNNATLADLRILVRFLENLNQ